MKYESVLFIDLLGLTSLWKTSESYKLVKAKMEHFQDKIKQSISVIENFDSFKAYIYSDSVLFLCDSGRDAIDIGKRIFCDCFDTKKGEDTIYLRGVISNWNGREKFYNDIDIPLGNGFINKIEFDDDFLRTISIEKSGFKGMRLLIHDNSQSSKEIYDSNNIYYVLNEDVENGPAIKDVLRLSSDNFYSTSLTNSCDVLWMINTHKQKDYIKYFKHLRNVSKRRFRKSTYDRHEFEQATWTRLLFENVESIIGSILKTEV